MLFRYRDLRGGGGSENKVRPPIALMRVWTTVGKLIKVLFKKLI